MKCYKCGGYCERNDESEHTHKGTGSGIRYCHMFCP